MMQVYQQVWLNHSGQMWPEVVMNERLSEASLKPSPHYLQANYVHISTALLLGKAACIWLGTSQIGIRILRETQSSLRSGGWRQLATICCGVLSCRK